MQSQNHAAGPEEVIKSGVSSPPPALTCRSLPADRKAVLHLRRGCIFLRGTCSPSVSSRGRQATWNPCAARRSSGWVRPRALSPCCRFRLPGLKLQRGCTSLCCRRSGGCILRNTCIEKRGKVHLIGLFNYVLSSCVSVGSTKAI